VNQRCYLEVLTRLRESVRKKRPELWPDKWCVNEFASSWLKNPLQKWTIHLTRLT
jgi:hypothetical protein